MHPRIVRMSRQVLAGLGVMVLVVAVARAVPDFQADLVVRYPNAASLGCAACHTDPANGILNPFGQAYLENGLAFTPALEALDSDGDGVPNGDELKYAPASNPGDAQSKPGMTPPTPAQPAGEGAALYGSHCASCHGPLATSTKRGATASRTQGAIGANVGGMGYLSMLTTPQVDAIAAALAAAPTTGLSSSNYTGLWWNPAESGWGISLNHQGDTVFAALFTYGSTGTPMWLVMSAGTKQADGRTYAGTLYRARGPAFDAVPFTPVGPSGMTAVGSLAIAFDGGASATLTYTVNGATVVKRIVPQVFGGAAAVCTPTTGSRAALTNYQDLWWNPAESGWGVTITHQADTMFAALFTYDASGNDLWLVMTQGTRQADGSWRGDLFRTRGPAFDAQPFTPLAVGDVTKVGEARFAFSDGATGTLNFSVDGRAVTKSITRQVFANGSPACASPASPQPVAGTDGPALYASYCASCHRPLESSTKGGATLGRTQTAIAGNVGGMGFLSNLSTPQLEAIVAALAPLVPTTPACGSCHSVPPVTGGHVRHEPRANCATCHGAGYGLGSVNAATHDNGVKEVLAAIGWNAAARTCTNGCHGAGTWSTTSQLGCTSCHAVPPASGAHARHNATVSCATCHGAGYSATTVSAATHGNGRRDTAPAIGWNAGTQSCANACHGSTPWSPTATFSCTSCHGAPPATGAHVKHNTAYACSTCHGGGYTATTVNAATHRNGVRETVASIGWNAGTQSCANACHGSTPWSPTATFSCTSCHGNPPATGGHAKHNTRFACSSCHGAGYSASTVGATHRNGVKEVIASVGWNATSQSCANACHGSGTWSSTATLSCSSCHGNPPSTGKHSKHRSRACSSCHGPGYTSTTVNAATHNNGVKEMATASGWTPSTRSCANSCHGKETW